MTFQALAAGPEDGRGAGGDRAIGPPVARASPALEGHGGVAVEQRLDAGRHLDLSRVVAGTPGMELAAQGRALHRCSRWDGLSTEGVRQAAREAAEVRHVVPLRPGSGQNAVEVAPHQLLVDVEGDRAVLDLLGHVPGPDLAAGERTLFEVCSSWSSGTSRSKACSKEKRILRTVISAISLDVPRPTG